MYNQTPAEQFLDSLPTVPDFFEGLPETPERQEQNQFMLSADDRTIMKLFVQMVEYELKLGEIVVSPEEISRMEEFKRQLAQPF